MKVAILTDPPNTVRILSHAEPQFLGNYLSIVTLQYKLEQAGHGVVTYIALPGKRILSENGLRELIASRGKLDAGPIESDESALFEYALRDADCVVCALKKASLMSYLPILLQSSEVPDRRLRVFVSIGPVEGRNIKNLFGGQESAVVILERPGVARLTRDALNTILEHVGRPESKLDD